MQRDDHAAVLVASEPAPIIRAAFAKAAPHGLGCVALVLIMFSWLAHWNMGLAEPLWLDEAGTAAFANSATFSQLVSLSHGDSNAPIYYVAIWFWAKLFGVSNISLRIPSLLLSMLTPALGWAGLRRIDSRLALSWSVLLALWGPGILLSGYARCYSMLYFTVAATLIAYIRLLCRPSLQRATLWTLLSAISILVHYDAAFLILVQGLSFVWTHRSRALLLWPSTAAFIPVAAYMMWHLPVLAAYANPSIAWYGLLSISSIPHIVAYIYGIPAITVTTALSSVLVICVFHIRTLLRSNAGHGQNPVLITGLTSLVAGCLLVGLGFLRPSFSTRYLTAFVPGILLLTSFYAWRLGGDRDRTLTLSLVGYAVFSLSFWLLPNASEIKDFEYETASRWISETSPSRLVFMWDNPSAVAIPEPQLVAMGGIFFRRLGLSVEVKPVAPQRGRDMNEVMMEDRSPGTAILWIYDSNVHDTTALIFPPDLNSLGRARECRQFGNDHYIITACRQRNS